MLLQISPKQFLAPLTVAQTKKVGVQMFDATLKETELPMEAFIGWAHTLKCLSREPYFNPVYVQAQV